MNTTTLNNIKSSGIVYAFVDNSWVEIPMPICGISDGCITVSFVYNWKPITKLKIVNFQLEEGTVATPYEPYQEDKLTILSPTPLEKIGDVADRIICKDGVWGVEKNVKEYTFTGSENIVVWNGTIDNPNTNTVFCPNLLVDAYMDDHSITSISNKFESLTNAGSVNRVDVECFSSRDTVYFRLLKSNSGTLEDAKKYIKGTIIKYQTTQPQFIPLPHDQQVKLRTFADRTHIHFETEIEGTIKAQVPKSLGATVNSHTSQIDNLNKELDRVKKLEESTVSTVTSDKAFTTVSETTQGYFEDVKLEGKTLVNLHPINYEVKGDYSLPANLIFYLHTNANDNKAFNSIIKPSTTYTIILDDIIEEVNQLYLMGMTVERTGKVTKITTPPSLSITYFHFYIRGGNYTEEKFEEFKSNLSKMKITILEGDHTDKDITFFEGLKSVGQDSNEISVLSCNARNLFDGEYELGGYSASGTEFESTSQYRNKNRFVPVVGGIKLYFSKRLVIHQYDINKKFIKYTDCQQEIKLEKNCAFINFRTLILNIEDLYIGYNLTSKPYKPIKQDKKQILYYNPTTQTWEKPVLREWDSIEKHSDGKYYYHKRSDEIALDGTLGNVWTYNTTTNGVKNWYCGIIKDRVKPASDIVCDTLERVTISQNIKGIRVGETKNITILLNESDIASNNLNDWLKLNPTTLVYQLAQEEVYECTNLDLITYPNETNLIVNSGAIQPKLELKVLSNVSNVVKLLQEKVSILENKFIEGLKQVLAGDMYSLAYLLYPEDFALENDIPQVIPYIEEGDINE